METLSTSVQAGEGEEEGEGRESGCRDRGGVSYSDLNVSPQSEPDM